MTAAGAESETPLPDLHRQLQRAVRYSPATDTGGHGANHPGDDPTEHGRLWLERLIERRGKVDGVADLAAAYTGAMRAELAAQAGKLIDIYTATIRDLQRERDALSAKIAATEAAISKRRDGPSLAESPPATSAA